MTNIDGMSTLTAEGNNVAVLIDQNCGNGSEISPLIIYSCWWCEESIEIRRLCARKEKSIFFV